MQVIQADWPAPAHVHAFTTTRQGGHSVAPYDSFNLGMHVGDDSQAVQANRQALIATQQLPSEPYWLQQIHSPNIVSADLQAPLPEADAAFTQQSGRVLAVLTADCLPILMTDKTGTTLAAIHAGWRGLYAGIIANSWQHLNVSAAETLVWLGPAIGPTAYEVGAELRAKFVDQDPAAASAFSATANEKYHCDLYQLARLYFNALGIHQIYGGQYSTYDQPELFYSYRRSPQTGRLATLLWRD